MDARRRLIIYLRVLAGFGACIGGAAVYAAVEAATVEPAPVQSARPYLAVVAADVSSTPRRRGSPAPASAAAAAQRSARADADGDVFVGGVRLFAPAPGRVYEVRTAPLRVTVLLLAPGETVTAKAAGDTVRWRIGEAVSGEGEAARVQVLVKPLSAGLETNLVLSTTRQTYILHLRSGSADAYHAAVGWDASAAEALVAPAPPQPPPLSSTSSEDAIAAGPLLVADAVLDAGYRIVAPGRRPAWTPTAIFNDGRRTFIVLDPSVAAGEAPVLFLVTDGRPQLANYRQAGATLIVDRLFDAAELRLGDRRSPRVRIIRMGTGR